MPPSRATTFAPVRRVLERRGRAPHDLRRRLLLADEPERRLEPLLPVRRRRVERVKPVVEVDHVVLRLVEVDAEEGQVVRTRHAVGRNPVGDVDALRLKEAPRLALVAVDDRVAHQQHAGQVLAAVHEMVRVRLRPFRVLVSAQVYGNGTASVRLVGRQRGHRTKCGHSYRDTRGVSINRLSHLH